MAISKTTRTHLIYQFIILTLLFLGIGYNELLPERKFILFLAFLPMFCYQLLILSCCMELLPVPSFMNLGETASKKVETKTEKLGIDSLLSSPTAPSCKRSLQARKKPAPSPDGSEKIHGFRRWEKSAVNIGPSQKPLAYPQKSKSWVNLRDSIKCEMEPSLSREGSLDVLAPMPERKLRSTHALNKANRQNHREERASKVKSWRPSDFKAYDKTEDVILEATSTEETIQVKPLLSRVTAVQQDESELSKSYSFPFRQKRLETWLEMKESETKESNQSLDMPYWQTLGYGLAVKYEARRRRRAVSSPTKLNCASETVPLSINPKKSSESPRESSLNSKNIQKKSAKAAANCINKIKIGFSNLISKKKEDAAENVVVSSNKVLKPSLSFKSRNKNVSYQAKTEEKVSLPEFPRFLSNERPSIFYPKYIPFEKDRFESDVHKKMVELAEEHLGPRFQPK